MTHLKVAVRVRPLSRREVHIDPAPILSVENGKTISITNIKVPEQNAGDSRERVRRFTFDFSFGENSTQDDVFQAIEGVIGKAVKSRLNSCVLAYGQSSSGKTHTMMGFPHDPGLTPKLCQELFGYLKETAVGDEILAPKVFVSYLEIYNEKVRDLLWKNKDDKPVNSPALKVRQHPKKGPYVQGLTEHPANDSTTLLEVLRKGNNNRRVAATLNNPHSSRSHSVFIINFNGAKLTLVDLAGSERAGNRDYTTSRFREGANINKSLVALGNVISALAEDTSKCLKGTRRRFIPYRDSLLTWLLRDTLGGNSDTVMIATISPSSTCYSETVNTLRFGQRAKLIVSIPVVNEDPKERIIRELRTEIARLKEILSEAKLTVILKEENAENPKQRFETSEQDQFELMANTKDKNSSQNTTDKLVPVINFSSRTDEGKNHPAKLHRTQSMDHSSMQSGHSKSTNFGSAEVISSRKSSLLPSQATLRKRSIDKIAISKPNLEVRKSEKSVVTEGKPFTNVEAKVGSIRKVPAKPRAQIVAAVTNRLYSKTKKKEVGTDTSDLATATELPKELTICSNARMKLKELTRKALKAYRSKNEETQTDLFPVLRVKETSTDVEDLKLALQEMRSVETSTEPTENCTFLVNFDEEISPHLKKAVVMTRSCGTQSNEKSESTASMSFTKYLTDIQQCPKMDFLNTDSAIYTSSVNINISHNYINSGHRVSDSVSDDSLDDHYNVCFPTPDLISNHNSLEPSGHATELKEPKQNKIQHANCVISDHVQSFEESGKLIIETPKCSVASLQVIPDCTSYLLTAIDIPSYAAENCVVRDLMDCYCQNLSSFNPEMVKPHTVESKTYSNDCVQIAEPLVLKSIMKHFPGDKTSISSDGQESSIFSEVELPDSLEYHLINNNKKVRFGKVDRQNEAMFKAMSGFLEEATILMKNLTLATNKLEVSKTLEDYDLQVTISDVSGLCRGRKRKRKCHQTDVNCQTEDRTSDQFSQTFNPATVSTCTQIFSFDVPENKYESLLEESCRRLQEKIDSRRSFKLTSHYYPEKNSEDEELPQTISYNPWDLSVQESENVSLESNPVTFSDYGSLPRRKFKPDPSCSPSALLKQLASIRKKVVATSREELFSESSVL